MAARGQGDDGSNSGSCPRFTPGVRCEHCLARSINVCHALELDELVALDGIARRICVEPHEILFHEGDAAAEVFNVTSGMARLFKVVPDGRRQIVGFALTGDFLGLAMLDRHEYTAESVTKVSVCEYKTRDFSDLSGKYPHLLQRLQSFTGHELAIAHEQMVVLGRLNAEERVAFFILALRDRWTRIDGSKTNVALPMTRLDIADYLGLTVETVSRVFSRFARQKLLVVVPGGVRLVDPARLEIAAARA